MKSKLYFLMLVHAMCLLLVVSFSNGIHAQDTLQQNAGLKNDTTLVTKEMKEEDDDDEVKEQQLRKKYFENMHRAKPGVDWRSIEAENNFQNYFQWQQMNFTPGDYANGNLQGSWAERGSNNQSGRIEYADYDSVSNRLYVLTDAGVLIQGVPDSSNWHILNDKLRFTGEGLKVVRKGTINRLIVTAGLTTYYSDNEGQTYTPSQGFVFPVAWDGNHTEQIVATGDTSHALYCMVLEWNDSLWTPLYYLYRSVNKGANWSKVHTFSEGNRHEVVLWAPPGKNFIYALENMDGGSTNMYKIQGTQTTLLNSAPALSNFTPLQFKGIIENNKTKLYVLLGSCELYASSNLGKSWNYINTVPNAPVEAVFAVSPADSNKLILGGIPNCFTSTDGGQNMSLVNDWTDYYNNVATRLHSDERNIYFFKRANGTQFEIIVCDGGVYRSDDFFSTVHNISLKGLNAGEFYDVLADPTNASWLFGGTQDQGFQRTAALSQPGIVNFTQVISGDCGHFQLTRNYQTLWTENAGGQINYYYKSHGSLSNYDYTVPGGFLPEVGWLLPTAQVFPATKNQVFIAGGNITGGDGSHLIRLTGGTVSPYTITATQFSYDFKLHSDGLSGISAIGTTPHNANKIYVATEDGEFFYSSNAGASFTKSAFTGPLPWYGYGGAIYASRLTDSLVYYGGSGYSNPPVYRSTNGGVTFNNISAGLPSTLVNDLIANTDESLLFAATESGPYVYVVAANKWFPFASGIAPASVNYTSVDYDALTNTVRFSTYGRGIWDFKITGQPVIAASGK